MPIKLAEIIECDDYELLTPIHAEGYSIGWGYRDVQTGEVYTGTDDGVHWDETTAEVNAVRDGYTIMAQREEY